MYLSEATIRNLMKNSAINDLTRAYSNDKLIINHTN